MRDLEFFVLPLGDIKLEKLDIHNKKHIKAVRGLRDFKARTMCYDVKQDLDYIKRGIDEGNNFLVRNDDGYFGYIQISNDYEGTRVLSYVIQKKVRGKGLGKIMLTRVSNYLLDNNLADKIKLYVKRKNVVGKRLVESCGFGIESTKIEDVDAYSRGNKK